MFPVDENKMYCRADIQELQNPAVAFPQKFPPLLSFQDIVQLLIKISAVLESEYMLYSEFVRVCKLHVGTIFLFLFPLLGSCLLLMLERFMRVVYAQCTRKSSLVHETEVCLPPCGALLATFCA